MAARKAKPIPAFVARVLGLMLPLGPVHAKSMFGGYGFCLDGVMFALTFEDRLFLKVDDETRTKFAKAGCAPFTYQRHGRTVTMSYSEAPDGTLSSPKRLLPWAELGLAAANRAGRKKPKKQRGD
jgi:DNA transformation protein